MTDGEPRDVRIRVETPTTDFLSQETFTRAEARAEIRRRRREGGWSGCRFSIVPANKYAMTRETSR